MYMSMCVYLPGAGIPISKWTLLSMLADVSAQVSNRERERERENVPCTKNSFFTHQLPHSDMLTDPAMKNDKKLIHVISQGAICIHVHGCICTCTYN